VSVGNLWGRPETRTCGIFVGIARPAGRRHEDLAGARQQTAMARVLKPGHLIGRHSPSEGAPAPGAVIAVLRYHS
jgi:hypothetical protein